MFVSFIHITISCYLRLQTNTLRNFGASQQENHAIPPGKPSYARRKTTLFQQKKPMLFQHDKHFIPTGKTSHSRKKTHAIPAEETRYSSRKKHAIPAEKNRYSYRKTALLEQRTISADGKPFPQMENYSSRCQITCPDGGQYEEFVILLRKQHFVDGQPLLRTGGYSFTRQDPFIHSLPTSPWPNAANQLTHVPGVYI